MYLRIPITKLCAAGIIGLLSACHAFSQPLYPVTLSDALWHGKERTLRYRPDGDDFVIVNGNRRFTRALYGTNTAFRVEAGDLPEFAMYMPGMGGNLKFGLMGKNGSKWLIEADSITTRYRPGSMIYDIKDPLLGNGRLHLVIEAMAGREGLIIKAQADHVPAGVTLMWLFGGASGKKFSRDGDMGADPESVFYLKPENSTDNRYKLEKNTFTLGYGTGETLSEEQRYENRLLPDTAKKVIRKNKEQHLAGLFPASSRLWITSAARQNSPADYIEVPSGKTPALAGNMELTSDSGFYVAIWNNGNGETLGYADLAQTFNQAEAARLAIAGRIKVHTPDPYINTLGGTLSMAADAIWEDPSFMHGAIGWRMRLNGWRGPYVADPLGWHDRARLHFRAYAQSQVTTPLSGPVVADTALHLARQQEKMGTSIFSSGYISRNPGGDQRPHHYDMNLVYIDALLRHINWTGDVAFIREMWPVITRHLAWEKRNFDPDGDGLYDAYAAIWASDALQYSGGGVTHTSAYNYMANKLAGDMAKRIGEDPAPFYRESVRIQQAVRSTLWMPSLGRYAEFKDLLGRQLLHPSAGLWTVYHSIDADLPDAFSAYQSLRYIDAELPHIPVRAIGLPYGYYTLATTSWMPYTWSLNNVAMAEVMHGTLANWQAGRVEDAFLLWKSALLESMYLGGSPGNIQQISFYDAIRGETYRDFADPTGMTARTLVEGLFGIVPAAPDGTLTIRPGLPAAWNFASLETPDIMVDFKRSDSLDTYRVRQKFSRPLGLNLVTRARGESVKSIRVNGVPASWKNVDAAVGEPLIAITAQPAAAYTVEIVWDGDAPDKAVLQKSYAIGEKLQAAFLHAAIDSVYDPQHTLSQVTTGNGLFSATIAGARGSRTAFIRLKQGNLSWWYPLCFEVSNAVTVEGPVNQQRNHFSFILRNNTGSAMDAKVQVNAGANPFRVPVSIPAYGTSDSIIVPAASIVPGRNQVQVGWGDARVQQEQVTTWNATSSRQQWELVDLSKQLNDKVTNIFRHQYLSPRPHTPTLQLPVQGIGDWTAPLKTVEINDRGLKRLAGDSNRILLPQGIPFQTTSDSTRQDIVFTSQWSNFPREAVVPLSGSASHAYFLMAGSTNPMQSRLDNGELVITYTDGTSEKLALRNPDTWWPIEQDYLEDGFAFHVNGPATTRVHLKTGRITSAMDPEGQQQFNGKPIPGGAASVLDLPLNPAKALQSCTVRTIANDVVIGLMAITLAR